MTPQIRTAGRFDLDDLGPQEGEDAPGQGARPCSREIEDAHAGQRARCRVAGCRCRASGTAFDLRQFPSRIVSRCVVRPLLAEVWRAHRCTARRATETELRAEDDPGPGSRVDGLPVVARCQMRHVRPQLACPVGHGSRNAAVEQPLQQVVSAPCSHLLLDSRLKLGPMIQSRLEQRKPWIVLQRSQSQGAAEGSPGSLLQPQCHPAIAALNAHERATHIPSCFLQSAVAVLGDTRWRHGHGVQRDVQVDPLPAPGRAAHMQRRQGTDERTDTGRILGSVTNAVQRLAAGQAVLVHHPGQGLEDHLAAAPMGQWSVRPEVRHLHDHACRVIALHRSQVEAQTGDDDVGLLGQTLQRGFSIGRGEIDLPGILTQVQVKKELGANARRGGIKRRHGPDC